MTLRILEISLLLLVVPKKRATTSIFVWCRRFKQSVSLSMSLSILWYELNFSIEFLLNESGSPSRYWKSLEGSNRNTVLKVSVSEVIEKHEYTEHWVIFQNSNIQTMPSLVFSSHISLWLDECVSKASFTWRFGNSIADAHLRCRCSLYPLEPRGGGGPVIADCYDLAFFIMI